MTDLQIKMMNALGLSKEDFDPIDKDKLLEEAYLKAEYNSVLLEQLMEEQKMIFRLMKKRIQREGLTEENKNLLDVYLLGNRITQIQYEELMQLEEPKAETN